MKICCPKCNGYIENANINVAEDIYVCSICNELFKLSDILEQEDIIKTEKSLKNPPRGIWVHENFDKIKIKISTHSSSAIFLVFFTLGFSSFSFFGFFQTIVTNTAVRFK
jgi:hypothetical protein